MSSIRGASSCSSNGVVILENDTGLSRSVINDLVKDCQVLLPKLRVGFGCLAEMKHMNINVRIRSEFQVKRLAVNPNVFRSLGDEPIQESDVLFVATRGDVCKLMDLRVARTELL
jgi:hypothetical protein